MRIFDVLGRPVGKRQVTSGKTTISIEDLPNGIYTARVYDTQGVRSIRIIKE